MSPVSIVGPRLMLAGCGCVARVAEVLRRFGLSRPLVVTDPFMVPSGLVRRCLEPLEDAGIDATMFSDAGDCLGSPANNPWVPEKGEILAIYREAWSGERN